MNQLDRYQHAAAEHDRLAVAAAAYKKLIQNLKKELKTAEKEFEAWQNEIDQKKKTEKGQRAKARAGFLQKISALKTELASARGAHVVVNEEQKKHMLIIHQDHAAPKIKKTASAPTILQTKMYAPHERLMTPPLPSNGLAGGPHSMDRTLAGGPHSMDRTVAGGPHSIDRTLANGHGRRVGENGREYIIV